MHGLGDCQRISGLRIIALGQKLKVPIPSTDQHRMDRLKFLGFSNLHKFCEVSQMLRCLVSPRQDSGELHLNLRTTCAQDGIK